MFSNDQIFTVQKNFFQVLIDKIKIYVAGDINFKGVVFVTDMDVVIDDVIKIFQKKHYWDHHHLIKLSSNILKVNIIVLLYLKRCKNFVSEKQRKMLRKNQRTSKHSNNTEVRK
jgi:hypothetical protein